MINSSPSAETRALRINTAIAAFAVIANTAGLAVGLSKGAPSIVSAVGTICTTIAFASIVLVTGLAALYGKVSPRPVLRLHAFTLVAATIALVILGVIISKSASLGSSEIAGSTGTRTAWSVGWLTAIAVYASIQLRSFGLPENFAAQPLARMLPWIVGLCIGAFDLFVFFRFARHFVS